MYVVKVGEFYVKDVTWDIILSKEVMTGFTFEVARKLSRMLNAEIIEMGGTNEE